MALSGRGREEERTGTATRSGASGPRHANDSDGGGAGGDGGSVWRRELELVGDRGRGGSEYVWMCYSTSRPYKTLGNYDKFISDRDLAKDERSHHLNLPYT